MTYGRSDGKRKGGDSGDNPDDDYGDDRSFPGERALLEGVNDGLTSVPTQSHHGAHRHSRRSNSKEGGQGAEVSVPPVVVQVVGPRSSDVEESD